MRSFTVRNRQSLLLLTLSLITIQFSVKGLHDNFARDPLRSYFHDPQKNEIHFLYYIIVGIISINKSQLKTKELKIIMDLEVLPTLFVH